MLFDDVPPVSQFAANAEVGCGISIEDIDIRGEHCMLAFKSLASSFSCSFLLSALLGLHWRHYFEGGVMVDLLSMMGVVG